jgi:hypothetical protein
MPGCVRGGSDPGAAIFDFIEFAYVSVAALCSAAKNRRAPPRSSLPPMILRR